MDHTQGKQHWLHLKLNDNFEIEESNKIKIVWRRTVMEKKYSVQIRVRP